ncbi:MAG TPA: hypothetical protein VG387_08085 [Rhizomicrobium sp.]|jgi:hypothetical protein|nr:hypothetical protein [Rhizomicrobium sp.]
MRFVKIAAAAATLSLVLGTVAYAQDSEPASVTGCLHMQKKVAAALDANQSSPNFSQAKTQAQGAAGFCSQGLYKEGVSGYAHALELLGAN